LLDQQDGVTPHRYLIREFRTMLKSRSIVLSLTVATFAVLGAAGCQVRADDVSAAAAAGRAPADNTAETCTAFRNFEMDHLDKPAPAASVATGSGDLDAYLTAFNATAAADMTKLAGKASDPAVAGQLKAIASQIAVLAEPASSGKTYDQVAAAHQDVFTAGGNAWVALEDRCGKAIIPTP
jgi:hypothetical protein